MPLFSHMIYQIGITNKNDKVIHIRNQSYNLRQPAFTKRYDQRLLSYLGQTFVEQATLGYIKVRLG